MSYWWQKCDTQISMRFQVITAAYAQLSSQKSFYKHFIEIKRVEKTLVTAMIN